MYVSRANTGFLDSLNMRVVIDRRRVCSLLIIGSVACSREVEGSVFSSCAFVAVAFWLSDQYGTSLPRRQLQKCLVSLALELRGWLIVGRWFHASIYACIGPRLFSLLYLVSLPASFDSVINPMFYDNVSHVLVRVVAQV
jgi:hypothetical protein